MKGNYFHGKYHYPNMGRSDEIISFLKRSCPGDTDFKLWEAPIDYSCIESIIESAVVGFGFWRKLDIKKRICFLKDYREQLVKKKVEIAKAIALETGKPLWEAQTEAAAVVSKVDVTIEHSIPRIQTKMFPDIMPQTTGHLFFKPLGPSLIIGPFNFPCHLANTQILSALAAGNSIIFKPSGKTCYSGQLLIDCFHDAGFPKGVVNLIQGGGEAAQRIMRAKEIRGVYFTGSKEVGRKILKDIGDDVTKMIALELGGKNPSIVHKDANQEHALGELIKACFLTTGQRCTSTSLIVIHQDIINNFVSKFHEVAKKIIIDHPTIHDKAPFMGPLVEEKALEDYLLFMGMAKREHIKEIMRGKQLEKNRKGYYVGPSIHLAESFNPDSCFLSSEIFGPNTTFIPYQTIDEAIEISNATEYGLAASVFTKSKDIYHQCIQELDMGLVNFNRSTCGASPLLPFGGVKNSGNYRPAAVAAIDSCVYQMSGLEFLATESSDLKSIVGLEF